MAEKDTKKEPDKKDETKKTTEPAKPKSKGKWIAILIGVVGLSLWYAPQSGPLSLASFGWGDPPIDSRDVGVLHLTTDYPAQEHWIVTEPDERVDFQTVHNVDLEAAHNGIPVKRIFNAGGSKNLAIGIDVGPRTNLIYRIIGGTAQTDDLYYVKYRGQYPPRGWYKAALQKNQ